MKRTFFLLLAGTLLLVPALPQRSFQLNDGEPHGDAPYLVEDGWRALLNGTDLSGWHGLGRDDSGWNTTRSVAWERLLGPTRLRGSRDPGDRIINGQGRAANLVTDEKFGDVELYLEFMLAKGSNSGVYLHGLYEVQVFDSWKSDMPLTSSDCGGIYHRWIDNQGVGGSAPLVDANRRPGEWQSFHIWFRAPRFDADGHKTENARFIRVLHNGLLVQEDVELEGGTRAHMEIPEAAENPIMLQGDHGPVAYKNIYIRPLRPIIDR